MLGELDLAPDAEDLVGTRGRLTVAEHVRVATDELVVEVAADIGKGELARVLGDLRVEQHLHEHVAELLAQVRGIAGLDGVDDLVGLLDHVLLDGGVGLLLVPGAAVGLAQAPDGARGLLERALAARGVGAQQSLGVGERGGGVVAAAQRGE